MQKLRDMRKLLHKILHYAFERFKFFWILLTIIFLILFSYINWQASLNRSYVLVTNVANNLARNLDDFIEDMFHEMYQLPIYGKKNFSCTSTIPSLQHIIINSPEISGLFISDDKHQIMCSTLPDITTLLTANEGMEPISGPYKLTLFKQPIFVVQQKLANYRIGIVVLSSVLEHVLHAPKTTTCSVSLYDKYEKKNIIYIENNTGKPKVFIRNLESLSPVKTGAVFASSKLHSIDGIAITVYENHQTILYNLWYHQLLTVIVVLLISSLLYFLIKNIITSHYSLHHAIKQAIKNKQFYPMYQPLYDTKTGLYSGAEILLRWQDNQNEIIMPDFFIEEAEATGLIVPITLQIIDIVFQDSLIILKSNPSFHLAFNVSAIHFTDPQFFAQFSTLMKSYSISARQIIFEITERDLLDKNNELFIKKMRELRKVGFSLAVDDYGTGHASISYLQYFPFNYLKIDKLFIQSIGTKAITESLNDAIISLAKNLNLMIIAEGVETEEQYNYLLENGVRFLQGWYFSKALSIKQLIHLLQGEKNES